MTQAIDTLSKSDGLEFFFNETKALDDFKDTLPVKLLKAGNRTGFYELINDVCFAFEGYQAELIELVSTANEPRHAISQYSEEVNGFVLLLESLVNDTKEVNVNDFLNALKRDGLKNMELLRTYIFSKVYTKVSDILINENSPIENYNLQQEQAYSFLLLYALYLLRAGQTSISSRSLSTAMNILYLIEKNELDSNLYEGDYKRRKSFVDMLGAVRIHVSNNDAYNGFYTSLGLG